MRVPTAIILQKNLLKIPLLALSNLKKRPIMKIQKLLNQKIKILPLLIEKLSNRVAIRSRLPYMGILRRM